MELLINLIGYSATVVGTCMMLPQVIKSWKTGKVEDVSLLAVMLYVLNCMLWLAYGILVQNYSHGATNVMPVIITNAVALCIGIFQLYLKLHPRSKP